MAFLFCCLLHAHSDILAAYSYIFGFRAGSEPQNDEAKHDAHEEHASPAATTDEAHNPGA